MKRDGRKLGCSDQSPVSVMMITCFLHSLAFALLVYLIPPEDSQAAFFFSFFFSFLSFFLSSRLLGLVLNMPSSAVISPQTEAKRSLSARLSSFLFICLLFVFVVVVVSFSRRNEVVVCSLSFCSVLLDVFLYVVVVCGWVIFVCLFLFVCLLLCFVFCLRSTVAFFDSFNASS